MAYEYSENILVQEAAGNLLQNELGWEVAFAYNKEKLGTGGTFGRTGYQEILLRRHFKEAVFRLNPWLNDLLYQEALNKLEYRIIFCFVNAN